MISFQTRWVYTKTHMLKIGFSAKLTLSRISKKHEPISDWHSTITSCLLISLLSRIMFNSLLWLDFLSNWSCCSHNLIASKKTDLNQENSPFTFPVRSLLSARWRQLWLWFCAQVVPRMCLARGRFPPQPQANHSDLNEGEGRIGWKKGFSEILENILTAGHSVFKTLSGFRAYSHSVSFSISYNFFLTAFKAWD